MNQTRRAAIKLIMKDLQSICSNVSAIRSDEELAFDMLPDGLKGSERGEIMEAAISNLEDAESQIDDALDFLADAII